MSLAQSARSLIPLVVGLLIGGVGATLFLDSMPGSEGSPKEQAQKLEIQLKKTQNRLAALESKNLSEESHRAMGSENSDASHARERKRTLANIAADIRAGRLVNPDDIFKVTQPFLRDLAPLFDRMRIAQQQQMIDSMTGELARKYNLTPQNKETLGQWFKSKMDSEAKRWTELVAKEGTSMQEIMLASQNSRPDEGLEIVMGSILSGDKLAAFKAERLAERTERVQQEADRQVQRLDTLVGLNDMQRDQVFVMMARSSKDYDPTMAWEGNSGPVVTAPGGNREAGVLAILRPDQRAVYEADRQQRREEKAKLWKTMGVALPPDANFFDEDYFR